MFERNDQQRKDAIASTPRLVAAASPARGIRLSLLCAFELECGGTSVSLPLTSQRLLAFLALNNGPLLRVYVAGVLWSDATEAHASANLRSALWRLGRHRRRLVETTSRDLRLASDVEVDVHEATAVAHRALEGDGRCEETASARELLSRDLLPDWYDDWVVIEQEWFRQLRLHALESLCERLTAAGRFGPAAEAGLAAVAGEPLRESAHRKLIQLYLAEGNRGEAIRQYGVCRRLLRDRLGLAPSGQTQSLVRGLV
jgi:DNA-binding SARP family transcriptional activator